jgi:hypothetical protein
MNIIVSNHLPRGERLIVEFLKTQPNGTFSLPQKYLAQSIGYRRDTTNQFLKSLLSKKIITKEKKVGVDTRLKVITLIDFGGNDNE